MSSSRSDAEGEGADDDAKGFKGSFFRSSRFNIHFQELEFIKRVGEGNYGAVWKARYQGRLVAVKQLFNLDEEDLDIYFEREMRLLAYVYLFLFVYIIFMFIYFYFFFFFWLQISVTFSIFSLR